MFVLCPYCSSFDIFPSDVGDEAKETDEQRTCKRRVLTVQRYGI